MKQSNSSQSTLLHAAVLVLIGAGGLPAHAQTEAANEVDQIAAGPDEEYQLILQPISVEGEVVRNQAQGEAEGVNLDSIQTEGLANTSANLNQVLKSAPGVVVRETGGLGSSFRLSLNGLSGQQVRYFIDGTPMENFGSALTLNNFPVNLVERIDVYKGVVPVGLSADALGGAINITTTALDESLLDASLSLGSFGTARAALTAQKVNENGSFLRINSFLNRSSNDYEMNEVPVQDDLGNITGTTSVRRFHDDYESGMISVKGGVANLGGLEELSLQASYASNRDEEQHPDTSINAVYGDVYSDNETALLSGNWKQSFENVDVKAHLLAGTITETNYDKFSRDYDWSGEYSEQADPSQGEIATLSIFERTDEVYRADLVSDFLIGDRSSLAASVAFNYLDRSGEDRLDPNNTSFTFPNWVNKAILGLAYERSFLQEQLNASIFAKQYSYDAEINATSLVGFEEQVVRTRVDKNYTGVGGSVRYDATERLAVTASYEHAYRLPEADEILGSGKYIRPNPELEPESSHNVNLGLGYKQDFDSQSIELQSNLFHRNASDFIRYVADQVVYGIYENLESVRVQGIELSAAWSANDRYQLQSNLTWQDITDQTRVDDTGRVNRNYGSQLPNEPYLFGNVRFGVTLPAVGANRFSAFWSANYVHEFFLNWENSGDPDTKFTIPEQLTHDIDLEMINTRTGINAGLSLRNIFDVETFDNFNIQKPGRAAYLKLRYVY